MGRHAVRRVKAFLDEHHVEIKPEEVTGLKWNRATERIRIGSETLAMTVSKHSGKLNSLRGNLTAETRRWLLRHNLTRVSAFISENGRFLMVAHDPGGVVISERSGSVSLGTRLMAVEGSIIELTPIGTDTLVGRLDQPASNGGS